MQFTKIESEFTFPMCLGFISIVTLVVVSRALTFRLSTSHFQITRISLLAHGNFWNREWGHIGHILSRSHILGFFLRRRWRWQYCVVSCTSRTRPRHKYKSPQSWLWERHLIAIRWIPKRQPCPEIGLGGSLSANIDDASFPDQVPPIKKLVSLSRGLSSALLKLLLL